MSIFWCEEQRKMKEYIGCKIEMNWNDNWVKLTQLAMVQIIQYNFKLYTRGKYPRTPVEPKKLLCKV